MKTGLYSKLARNGIKKNRQLYLPYLFTCAGMVMMFYIVSYLAISESLSAMRGGSTMQMMLSFGQWVIGAFALLFLFYTNSFLIRRRKKEFGLFNILGMGKGNLARIMGHECLMIYAFSICFGLFCGILFSKLAELVMINILMGDVTFSFQIHMDSIKNSVLWFGVIFLVLLAHCLHQIRVANPIELLRSENFGERPPKANWLFALLGVLILSSAYYLAISIKEPLSAMIWFFIAVIMVIVATYILFVAGSVALCRLLQKNKNYYYKTRHFVSVSSMIFRMKRNGAGLASICILATMVLVMISSTVCLYIGKEDMIRARYPRDIMVDIHSADPYCIGKVQASVDQTLADSALLPINVLKYSLLAITANVLKTGEVILDENDLQLSNYSQMQELLFVPLSDYNRLAGANESLAADEILLYAAGSHWQPDRITISGVSLTVKKQVGKFVEAGNFSADILPSAYLIVSDLSEAAQLLGESYDSAYWHNYYGFDLLCEEELKIELPRKITASIRETWLGDALLAASRSGYSCESLAQERDNFYSLYGGLFFLGILLGIVFLFATVLIMYYKQISEGYEDQGRFSIMQKVGMTKTEIRQSINSQILTVFFLPLVFAGIHLAFAFPLISKLLILFGVGNQELLICTTFVCFAAFALFYVIVYRITSRAYFKLVSDPKE